MIQWPSIFQIILNSKRYMYRKTLKNSVSIHEFLEEVQNCKEREDSFYRFEKLRLRRGASYAAEPGLEFKRTELPSKPRRLPFLNWQRDRNSICSRCTRCPQAWMCHRGRETRLDGISVPAAGWTLFETYWVSQSCASPFGRGSLSYGSE